MSYTFRGWSSRAFVNGPLFLVASLTLGSCASQYEISPRYAQLKPTSVVVLPVGNETVYELDQVRFGGLLQRLIKGPEVYDVPALLRGALVEALKRRGFDAGTYDPSEALDFTRPLPAGTPEFPFDAVLVPTIHSWYSSGSGQWKIFMTGGVKLYHVPTGELLYSLRCNCSRTADSRRPGSPDLGRDFLVACSHKLLGSLPVISE